MQLLSRLKTLFLADANAAVDAAEDPAVMEAQAIRDLEDQLDKGVKAEVSLKTLVIEKQTKGTSKQKEADEWANKANTFLDQVSTGALSQEDADKYAGEALAEQQTAQHEADTAKAEAEELQKRLATLEEKVKSLKADIENLKNHISDVKSREQTAKAELGINQQMADFGKVNSAHELVNRMEEKVSHIENESKAVSALQDENKTEKQKMEEVLANAKKVSPSDALAALKSKRAGN